MNQYGYRKFKTSPDAEWLLMMLGRRRTAPRCERSVRDQNRCTKLLTEAFDRAVIIDRRAKPSHGYRAVHLIVREGEKTIEIQLRTALQQLWAELSEKFADVVDPALKYGGGPGRVRDLLSDVSQHVADIERLEPIVEVSRDANLSRQQRHLHDRWASLLRSLIEAVNDDTLEEPAE